MLNTNAIPTWPESYPSRWNVLLDSVLVGSKTVSVSSNVSGVPSGKAVVLLDSGTSYTYVLSAILSDTCIKWPIGTLLRTFATPFTVVSLEQSMILL